MSENTNLSLTLEAWADIVIKNWVAKIMSLKIHDTFALARSFEHHVWMNSGGDPERVEFAFLYYGRFVDMGVGEGKGLSGSLSRDQKRAVKQYLKAGRSEMAMHKWGAFRSYNNLHLKERIAKPWYSGVFFSEVQKLQNLLSLKYAHKAALYICENITASGSTQNKGKG